MVAPLNTGVRMGKKNQLMPSRMHAEASKPKVCCIAHILVSKPTPRAGKILKGRENAQCTFDCVNVTHLDGSVEYPVVSSTSKRLRYPIIEAESVLLGLQLPKSQYHWTTCQHDPRGPNIDHGSFQKTMHQARISWR